jgi:hypothetical protein
MINEFFKNFYVGGNLKYLQGKVGYLKQRVWAKDMATTSNAYDKFNDNVADSSKIAADIGLLYEFKPIKTRIGLLARNINKPKFEQPAAAKTDGLKDYSLDPQLRTGVAFRPATWWLLAADCDLTKNKTPIDKYYSRQFGFGTELNLINGKAFNLALRAGLLKNIAMDDAPYTYTAGLGLNILHVIVELSGGMSSDKVEIQDGESIPSAAYVNLSLGFNF